MNSRVISSDCRRGIVAKKVCSGGDRYAEEETEFSTDTDTEISDVTATSLLMIDICCLSVWLSVYPCLSLCN